ncbi:hypothetical protein CcaverHIS002_0204250 [Cutaneotrichosporon cavernicola]|nr:hypothetical protein CcaverHIS002_0204250 [Cutaneotrichosporon cavernicola]
MPVPPASRERDAAPDIGPILASQLAIEFASLRAPGNSSAAGLASSSCTVVLTPARSYASHSYSRANTPRVRPQVFFESDVFHPMVDPKTREWHPHGKLAQWKPHVDHVANLLHELKASFKTSPQIGRQRDDQLIRFTELDDPAVQRLWADLRRSLGER